MTINLFANKNLGFFAGPITALLIATLWQPQDLSSSGVYTAAIVAWMAIWWVTESAPIAVTALLPLALFGPLEITSIRSAANSYAHPIIFLFLGGFIVALAIENSNLHRRIALNLLVRSSKSASAVVGSFMFVSALLSMWMTNTATTIMLLPIAMSVVLMMRACLDEADQPAINAFAVALLLAIAYSASVGGMTTLVGTAPNAFIAAYVSEQLGREISFLTWMMVGVPAAAMMLPIIWLVLTKIAFKVTLTMTDEARESIVEQRNSLGQFSVAEKRTLIIFLLLILGWMGRPILQSFGLFDTLNDTSIAIAAAIAVCVTPRQKGSPMLVTWGDTDRVPWGVLLLLGGGLSMASAITTSGLAGYVGTHLGELGALHFTVLIVAMVAAMIFITEVSSNTASTATFVPIAAGVAIALQQQAESLIVPLTLAASCAFMLPVATPPNAIVFGAGEVKTQHMMKAGIWLNVLAVPVLTLVALLIVPSAF